MSKTWRIGFVVEGKTDFIVLSALVSEWLHGRCELNQLQPANSGVTPEIGNGWGGVYNWCRQVLANNSGDFYADLLFSTYDALIIHVDGDVALSKYSEAKIYDPDCDNLPCWNDKESIGELSSRLEHIVAQWCGLATFLADTLVVIPIMATEAWLFAALFPNDPRLSEDGFEGMAQPDRLFMGLAGEYKIVRSKDGRARKDTSRYINIIPQFIAGWPYAIARLESARSFEKRAMTLLCQ